MKKAPAERPISGDGDDRPRGGHGSTILDRLYQARSFEIVPLCCHCDKLSRSMPSNAKLEVTKRPAHIAKGKPAVAKPRGAAGKSKRSTATKSKVRLGATKPALLAGGNPQIAKADGDAPVQAYIAAMPGWKRDVGRRLDAIIARTVPGVHKAVKWNSPFYGIESQGWFLSFHCFTKYVKVTFFRGTSLRPVPPGESRHKEVRYLDIHEDDQLDEDLVTRWIRQASELPGWVPV